MSQWQKAGTIQELRPYLFQSDSIVPPPFVSSKENEGVMSSQPDPQTTKKKRLKTMLSTFIVLCSISILFSIFSIGYFIINSNAPTVIVREVYLGENHSYVVITTDILHLFQPASRNENKDKAIKESRHKFHQWMDSYTIIATIILISLLIIDILLMAFKKYVCSLNIKVINT